MKAPLPISELLDEWLKWVKWVSAPDKRDEEGHELIGWDEFNWITQQHPEHSWLAIQAAVKDSRLEPYLGTLAAGPLEDLLSLHGSAFINRIEAAAVSDPKFGSVLGGVNQSTTSDEVWSRVVAVREQGGWDGNPR